MSAIRWSAVAILFLVFVQPPVDAAAPETKSEQVSVFGVATLSVPAEFKRTQVKSSILEHEFQASAGEGSEKKTARVTMMAASGELERNIKRWKDQFIGGADASKTEETKSGDWTIYIVDVAGRYKEPAGRGGPFSGGKVVERPGYAMTGAIFVHPEGRKYFVKMIGPEQVVKANRKAFVEMIKGIEK